VGRLLSLSRRAVGVALVTTLVSTSAPRGRAQDATGQPVNECGPANAPVTIVEFCRYDSEPCARVGILLDVMLHEFGDRVRLVFHHLPADTGPAPSLRYRAALAAGNQGRFWDMHAILLANRDRATDADVFAMAGQLQLDDVRFRADLASSEIAAAVERDRNDAAAQGVTSTPALIVNGQPVTAFTEAKDLRAAITHALSR
jgi:NhaA family Na+:H+ antiporter